MEKSKLLWIAAVVALLLGWQPLVNVIWPPRDMTPEERARWVARTNQLATAQTTSSAPAAVAPPGAPAPTAQLNAAPAALVTAPQGTIQDAPTAATLTNAFATWEFVAPGAGIRSITLQHHRQDGTNPVALNPGAPVTIGGVAGIQGAPLETQVATAVTPAPDSVRFDYDVLPGVRLAKIFTLVGDYQLKLALAFTNTTAQPVKISDFLLSCGASGPMHPTDQENYIGADYHTGTKFHQLPLPSFSESKFLGMFKMRDARPEITEPGPLAWITSHSQFFLTLLEQKDTPLASMVAQRITVPRLPGDSASGRNGVLSYGRVTGFDLPPGASTNLTFEYYTGPREYARLKGLGVAKQDVMNFGMFWWVSVPLLNLMNLLHSIPPHNFGLSIILMVVVVRGLFWPLQSKVNVNMKRMQAIQQLPEMVKAKEKFKDDPQRLNLESMNLMRAYGVNPMAGCFPLLLQMPVFFGFYAMLQSAVELRGAPFLFIPDLSQPWTLFRIPGLDFPFNPLPLIMGATSVWQMSITPNTSMDKTQAMMLKFMPLMFVVFCYNFSSALALYWTVQNLVGIVQMYHNLNAATPQLVKVNKPKGRWAKLMEQAQQQSEAERNKRAKK